MFSASSKSSLHAILNDYATFLDKNGEDISVHDLAWTLRQRRSLLCWRTSIVASSLRHLRTKISTHGQNNEPSVIIKALPETQNSVLGIFTGQGAQYVRMGAELIQASETARTIIQQLESHLEEIPDGNAPNWSLVAELFAESSSRVHEAIISQPLCTAVQILLVDLLRLGGVHFNVVVGHSSGMLCARTISLSAQTDYVVLEFQAR